MSKTEIVFRDRYYVYGLFKPCGTPFYIGKGKNSRIDEHFRDSRLKEDSYKNRVIKKLGKDSVKREVLAYFDSEESAYIFEEYLINTYKLKNDGGCLANVLRSNRDYVNHSPEVNIKKGTVHVKHSEDLVVQVYKLYYEDCIRAYQISESLGVPHSTVSAIVIGQHRKDLYSKYILSAAVVNNLEVKEKSSVIRLEAVRDCDLIEAYNKACMGTPYLDISEQLSCTVSWLRQVFCGYKREHLAFDIKRDRQKQPPRLRTRSSSGNKENS